MAVRHPMANPVVPADYPIEETDGFRLARALEWPKLLAWMNDRKPSPRRILAMTPPERFGGLNILHVIGHVPAPLGQQDDYLVVTTAVVRAFRLACCIDLPGGKSQQTALSFACASSSVGIVQAVLAAGASNSPSVGHYPRQVGYL